MTIAPASAPASGRANSRARVDLRPTRSSLIGGGVTSACNVSLMGSSQLRPCGGSPEGAGDPSHGVPYLVPRSANTDTLAMLVLSMNDGPVSTVWPPPRMLPLTLYSHSASIDMYPCRNGCWSTAHSTSPD